LKQEVAAEKKLKASCVEFDENFAKRSKVRSSEIQAVSETIAILTEDANREHLASTLNFLQVRAHAEASALLRKQRMLALKVLRRAADSQDLEADDLLNDWDGRLDDSDKPPPKSSKEVGGNRAKLSALAMSLRIDSFTKVKATIDKIVAELKKEQQAEVDFKAYCTKELRETERSTARKTNLKDDLSLKIDQLQSRTAKLQKDIDGAKQQMADISLEVKEATENREAEHAVSQKTIADQRATQEILKKALSKMQAFYGGQVSMTQVEPPQQYGDYKKNQGAAPVMAFLKQIISDAEALEQDAISGEKKAQADYEAFVNASNLVIADLSDGVNKKTETISKLQLQLSDAQSDHTTAADKIKSLSALMADLHSQCDFVLKNFDVRQKARLAEIEAVQEAKGILSGAKWS